MQRIGEGEDQLREDQHRCDGIDEEIKEFGRATNDHADGDIAGGDGAARMHAAGITFES